MRKLSRMEATKDVRRILNRHGVDLSYSQYSVAGMDIRLSGWLCKHDGSDFNSSQIEGMIQEFQRVLAGFSITGDFENWNFSTDHISFLGERSQGVFQEESDTRYEILLDDYEEDVG